MTTLNPWINFNGNAEEAFNFYKLVFGGEFSTVTRFKDVPGSGVEGPEGDKLMKIVLPVGTGGMLIGNDVPSFMGTVSENENRSKIHIGLENKEEAQRIFAGLSSGGQVEVPLGDGAFAMFRDKYGIEWILESAPSS